MRDIKYLHAPSKRKSQSARSEQVCMDPSKAGAIAAKPLKRSMRASEGKRLGR